MNRMRIFLVLLLALMVPHLSEAATLRLSPGTGVYTAGTTFTASVLLNTQGKPVNAADAQISFNPRELSVVGVSKGGLFTLWTLDPTFSNAAGTISFGGGSPQGYTGSNGSIMTVTFRALAAGTPKVNFTDGSVLAADGLGTNVLTDMSGGSYTVQAKSDAPPPEYVPPANTPKAPVVRSSTHPKADAWYKATTAELSWDVPTDVTSVRTALDTAPSSIPTKVYEEPITSRELTDLPEGTSYFHIQFKNKDGWGRVTHVPLNVDTKAPTDFAISEAEGTDQTHTDRTLLFTAKDTSPIASYAIQLDGGERVVFEDRDGVKAYTLTDIAPGDHTVVVEAFDSAGNSVVGHYSFTVATFEAPLFTDVPTRVNAGVIPAFLGTARSGAEVTVTIRSGDSVVLEGTTHADETGAFVFIPPSKLAVGVYDVSARAHTSDGSVSEPSESLRFVVDEPGYLQLGAWVVSFLSVLVPLAALLIVLFFGTSYLVIRMRRWKKRALRETLEAEDELRIEFDDVLTKLDTHVTELERARKSKVTKAEQALIDAIRADLTHAKQKIAKEIKDIEDVVQ